MEKLRYFDINGVEIKEGDFVIISDGGIARKVYETAYGELGIDATNPAWIESGRAVECEYGIYPFCSEDMNTIRVVDNPNE